jgi:hypothetical protein
VLKRQNDGKRVLALPPLVLSPAAVKLLMLMRIRKDRGLDFARRLAGALSLLDILHSLTPRDPASEPAKNGPWLRKDAWLLYKAKVNASPYVAV